ncbi:MAG: hypothetical protein ACPHHU_02590 [Paracoccaceae bacterium]
MGLNRLVVKVFSALIVLLHFVVICALGLGLYFESDPEAAMQLILQFDLTFLLDPPFELMIALAFAVYVIFVGALSLLINMSQRLDQSVKVLEEIRDAVQYNNSENY